MHNILLEILILASGLPVEQILQLLLDRNKPYKYRKALRTILLQAMGSVLVLSPPN